MAFIYKITNDKNDKIYIGKTEFSIQKRFAEHCQAARKETLQHRPLYNAMRKYGTDCFHIEMVEETDCPEEREKYWIQYYDTYTYGYNATFGGDGKRYVDYDKIIEMWKDGKTAKEISNMLHHDECWVAKIIRNYGEASPEEMRARQIAAVSTPVAQIDKTTGEQIAVFESTLQAQRALNIAGSHIASVCKGKRKTVGGYAWKYV